MAIRETEDIQPVEAASSDRYFNPDVALAPILSDICSLLAGHRQASLSSVFVRQDRFLLLAAASGFPADSVVEFQRVPDSSDLLGPKSLYGRFWEQAQDCPLWVDHAALALRLGVVCSMTSPVHSSQGELLGLIARHYMAQPEDIAGERELLQAAGRLAAVTIQQREMQGRFQLETQRDALTGLPSRRTFLERLDDAVWEASKHRRILAVLAVDLDRFQHINDNLGHATGDRVLQEAGDRIRRLLTAGDAVGRTGGDEFAIALANRADHDHAMRSAGDVQRALAAPYILDGRELFVSASLGVAMFPRHGNNPADLLRDAELALHHAKRSGRNTIEAFQSARHAGSVERLQLENALRRAMDNRELELLYQPVFGMQGELKGFEVLLTWRHPVYGTVSPGQFIPIAEETGLIAEIGFWVMLEACKQGVAWQEAGHTGIRLSVNVSALQFERGNFADAVAAALAVSGYPPRSLEIELTESILMRDVPAAALRLAEIRELGASVAIDDFGTGYSSLSYLSKLPIDTLKIDQSFLRGVTESDGALPVIQSIVRLAHGMNLTVVAEGVETQAELELMRLIGCDRVQGHLCGPALPAEDAGRLLASTQRAAATSAGPGA